MTAVLAPTLAGYRRSWLRADVVAGLSAGAVVIPQARAYATIADMPVQIGLYTCMVPMIVYALLGGSRTASVSTTSTIATLTASTLIGAGIASGSDDAQTALMILTLMVGVILIAARVLKLGAIIENISEATLSGIKAGVGLTVAASQLPKLLRIEFWVAAVTAVIGLTAGLLPAVLVGVVMTLYLVLRELNRPHISQLVRDLDGIWTAVDPDGPPIASDPLVLRIDLGLYTANVRANTREISRRVTTAASSPRAVVLDCSRLYQVTTTVMKNFVDLTRELSDAGVTVYFAAVPPQNLATVRRTVLGRDYESQGRMFDTVEAAARTLSD
ncbi:SulP family inorganic anion transporter [Rhodococcus sp. TAF43]|uniref:SulP family inorganic anion transporter n=1 Tax=Rhodococcus sp. TAF43 TaxID=3237483 RepID=UPI003F9442A7